eukprot:1892838-Prymnesium_polylepis.1
MLLLLTWAASLVPATHRGALARRSPTPQVSDSPAAQIVWLTGCADLRLSDHDGFARASAAGGEVLPVFVLDPDLLSCRPDDSLANLHAALTSLDDALGGRLIVRSGTSASVLTEIARKSNAAACHFLADDTETSVRTTQRA